METGTSSSWMGHKSPVHTFFFNCMERKADSGKLIEFMSCHFYIDSRLDWIQSVDFYVFLLWGCPHCCCFFLRLSAHNISKKIKSGGVRRGLRHSQSMKGKNHAVATLPGVCEQNVKLQTLRPIILSNIEHIGEYNNCYALKFCQLTL